ncbi:unnamed protein product [Hymenolepis diminuta]|uniref:Uncharacterized protein n=1 Tax=Hymenolepis diminuta TaxID=6216 RepID=A0A564YCF7_HYMDI|nr:unnamed protein product [Hymenolepis diminuta]
MFTTVGGITGLDITTESIERLTRDTMKVEDAHAHGSKRWRLGQTGTRDSTLASSILACSSHSDLSAPPRSFGFAAINGSAPHCVLKYRLVIKEASPEHLKTSICIIDNIMTPFSNIVILAGHQ